MLSNLVTAWIVTDGFSCTRTFPLMSLPEPTVIANIFLGLLQTGLLACLKGGCRSRTQTEQVTYICIVLLVLKRAHKPTPINNNFPNSCEVQSCRGQSFPSLIHSNALGMSSLFQILTQGEWTHRQTRTLTGVCL